MVDFNSKSDGHLILTRKHGETIVVDGPAVFEIIEERGGRAKISIRAPRSTKVLRGELVDQPRRPAA